MPSARTSERKTGVKEPRTIKMPTKTDRPKLFDVLATDADTGEPITRADRMIDAIRHNQTIAAACAAGGVDPATHYSWLRAGANVAAERHAMQVGEVPWKRISKRDEALWWYATSIAEAEAQGEGRLVAMLDARATGELTAAVVTRKLEPDQHGNLVEVERVEKRNKVLPDTAALTFMLRQKWPERWGHTEQLQVLGDPTRPVEHRVTHSVEGLDGVLEAVARRISEPIDTSAAEIPALGRVSEYDGPVGAPDG